MSQPNGDMKMSHEVETMAYANEVPWHGLGANINADASVEEMLKAAGLDWSLVPQRIEAIAENGTRTAIGDKQAWVRDADNRVMAVSGKAWRPLQPADTLGFMHNYVQAGAATLETAGSLRDGKVIWGLARLKHDFEVGRGDRVNGYLLITSPNVVGSAITIRTTTVRVVCANTMAMAEAAGGVEYRQNHLSDFNVDAAKEAVGNAHEQLANAERSAKTLAKFKISIEDAMKNVIRPTMFPALEDEMIENEDLLPNSLTALLHSIRTAPGQKEIEGTGWAILNGVTHWADHVAGQNNGTRMFNSWMGQRARQKLDVERVLLEMAA